jgi:RNA polymerase sigma-70 factor (ECF subfamily)
MVASNDFHDARSSVRDNRAARAALSAKEALYDAGLVTRFNAGDETAFNEIVLRYRIRLAAVAFSVLKNQADAEEIAQDAFIRAHRGLANFRGDSSLISWLHCIALNLARNRYWYFYRRCRHATISLDSRCSDERPGNFSDLVATEEAGPPRRAVAREFSELVSMCIVMLNGPQQEILDQRVGQGRSYDAIAEALGITVGTVKSRVARARRALRVLMTQFCPQFGRGARPEMWFEPIRPDAMVR